MPLPVKAAAAEALPPSSAGDGGGSLHGVAKSVRQKTSKFCFYYTTQSTIVQVIFAEESSILAQTLRFFPRIFSKVIAFCRGVCYTFVLSHKNAVSCGKAGSYPLPPA